MPARLERFLSWVAVFATAETSALDVLPVPVVVVSDGVVVVPVSVPELATGGEPVSAAEGYAATPTPTNMATATAKRAARRHWNRLNVSLRATAFSSPPVPAAAFSLSRNRSPPSEKPLPLSQRGPNGRIHRKG